jgi:DMSO/TMAO reductase YedYZ molybdopterin-dependent catalytic subunit/mono/diheme cytochrome c family protein
MTEAMGREYFMQSVSRRFLMKALATGVALASNQLAFGSATRSMPAQKMTDTFVVHNDLPWALETRRSQFGFGPITPASHFFVRNNLPMPSESETNVGDDWVFEVLGCEREGQLTVADLKRMKTQVVATVLQCSGNGRDFFPHDPSGSQWSVGAAGCALWTGVAVADIFERFGGVKTGLSYLTATGGETLPEGIDKETVVVERSVPLEKGLKDCLLVWEMNGAPLSAVHGGPIRLVVPGYFGVNNVKWVRQLAAAQTESTAKIQQSGYRFRPEGESGGPQHPSMWRMPVKSWLSGPGADSTPVLAGPNTLYGVAFSGERGISAVELSADNGQTWQPAELVGPDLGPNAWRTFQLSIVLPVGEHQFVSRATDAEGDRQPQRAEPNHRGYGHNGWMDHALAMTAVAVLPEQQKEERAVSPSTPSMSPQDLSPARALSDTAIAGKQLFVQQAQPGCGVCHSLADADARGVVGPNLNTLAPNLDQVRGAITQGVGAMPAYGAQLSASEIEALATYVVEATR